MPYTRRVGLDAIYDELRRAGKDRQAALDADAAARARIARLAAAALRAGGRKWDIAQAAQISRPSLDDMLKRHEPASRSRRRAR